MKSKKSRESLRGEGGMKSKKSRESFGGGGSMKGKRTLDRLKIVDKALVTMSMEGWRKYYKLRI